MPERDIPSTVDTQLADIYERLRRIERQLAATATIELPGGIGNLTVLFGQANWGFGPIANGDMATVSIQCIGAQVGDPAVIAFESLDSLPGSGASLWDLWGWIITDDFVWITFWNRTGSAVTVPSGAVRAVVFHYEP